MAMHALGPAAMTSAAIERLKYRGRVVSLLMAANDGGGDAAQDAIPHVIGRSMNGLSVPSASITPAAASAVTMRQRRSVSMTRPARLTAAGSLSSRVDSTATWLRDSTDVHSALTNASWWSDPGAASRAR